MTILRAPLFLKKTLTSLFFLRSRYNDNGNKIVFLALSDDYDWIKVGDNKEKKTF